MIAENRPTLGIAFILVGMLAISVNDTLIKLLAGDYPLHQMVFTRSAIGICFSLTLVQFEGGWRILRTARPGLHLIRGLAVVIANMTFFAALAVLPLATATALFFIAPLLITLLSIPMLGERVGPRRLIAVLIGFAGVLMMMRPSDGPGPGLGVLALPLLAACFYAFMQVLTRKLGIASKASAMAVYLQGTFILVSLGFFAIAGDGRFAEGVESPSLVFLLRAWVWPAAEDWPLFLGLGLNSAIIGYSLSAAYRSADAGLIAPFEYTALALAVFWGWAVFGEVPSPQVMAGIALIGGAGLFVFARNRKHDQPVRPSRPVQR